MKIYTNARHSNMNDNWNDLSWVEGNENAIIREIFPYSSLCPRRLFCCDEPYTRETVTCLAAIDPAAGRRRRAAWRRLRWRSRRQRDSTGSSCWRAAAACRSWTRRWRAGSRRTWPVTAAPPATRYRPSPVDRSAAGTARGRPPLYRRRQKSSTHSPVM